MHRYDWHLCTVVRINDRNGMRVSVQYFDDEPREPLRLSEEQWGIMEHPQPKVVSRAGSAADKLVKQQKGKRGKKSSRKSDLKRKN